MRPDSFDAFQLRFHQRWHHLRDAHVRALAWLLDAPDLLDAAAPQWHGRIATVADDGIAAWLAALDRAPAPLHAELNLQPFARLGRYAEQLMAYYLRERGSLFAHGVQVRAGKNDTIGEFDFLLRDGDTLVHWEFATKFYLLESSGAGHDADYFVGPNLADTLGAKMRKIFDRQLALSRHPAAAIHLPLPVGRTEALVKGWLFHHGDDAIPERLSGVSARHCRGFWCTAAELPGMRAERYAILPRLQWLAPARIDARDAIDAANLQVALAHHFAGDSMPVMVALLALDGADAVEASRGFVVPDDWRARAAARTGAPQLFLA